MVTEELRCLTCRICLYFIFQHVMPFVIFFIEPRNVEHFTEKKLVYRIFFFFNRFLFVFDF